MQNLEISIFAMQKYWNFKIWHIESWNFKIWHANYLQWPPLPWMWITLFIHKLHSYLEETHICLDSNICLLIQDTVDQKIKPSGDNQETFDSMYLGKKGASFVVASHAETFFWLVTQSPPTWDRNAWRTLKSVCMGGYFLCPWVHPLVHSRYNLLPSH